MIMLLTPESLTEGAVGMELLQAAMGYHLGQFGVIFIAATLWLFSFSTFLGILYYARSNISYLFGDGMLPQNLYKVLALVMMFIGGLAAYTVVWDLGDVGVGLMTVFNIIMLYPMSGIAIKALKSYEAEKRNRKKNDQKKHKIWKLFLNKYNICQKLYKIAYMPIFHGFGIIFLFVFLKKVMLYYT